MSRKVKWLLENGFKEKLCDYNKVIVYEYKGYSWTNEEIKSVPLSTLMSYKRFYDGEINEPRFLLEEDSICYGCAYYGENGCEVIESCIEGSMNNHTI